MSTSDLSTRRALRFVVLIGVVSLFADMTYEGARSINGPFLAVLGASGTLVGVVSGLGELLGYSVRLLSGYLADRQHRYWSSAILGYAINLLAVPLLALAGNWPLAAFLMVSERLGKGIRVPPRDSMLSYATSQMGHGWGFGLHEALDQLGAVLGPLAMSAAIYFRGDYQSSYGLLLIPALLALAVLVAGRLTYPQPQDLERSTQGPQLQGFSRTFWLYVTATALIAAGFADFPLIAYHFQKTSLAGPTLIPIFYAVAMGVDALAALAFGRLFDRIGLTAMLIAAALSSIFAPLVFLGSIGWAVLGMALWGIGVGAHESVMRAVVAVMIPSERRGLAFGAFNAVYGGAWFVGSVLIGVLYDVSIPWLVAFSMIAQLAALPILLAIHRKV